MGKNPAFLFYPGDWERDLEEHPLEIEGAWIRICCKLWWSDKRGVASKTLDQWSRVLRLTPKKTEKILEYLSQHSIADLVKQNSTIQITCRRMVRDEYIRTVRKEAGSKGGNPALKSSDLLNQTPKQKPTLSVSSSVSGIELPKGNLLPEDSGPEQNGTCPHSAIIKLYHEKLPMLRGVREWNKGRQRFLRTRWNENEERQSLEWWGEYFDYVKTCPWLIGQNENGWQADLEWLVRPSNFIKVIEGNYEPRKQRMTRR